MEYTPRRKLTREFKLEAVRQVALSEKPKAQLALAVQSLATAAAKRYCRITDGTYTKVVVDSRTDPLRVRARRTTHYARAMAQFR